MAEEFVNANLILPGTYIRVRSEGLIGVGGISTGNIGIVGTADTVPGRTVSVSTPEDAADAFGAANAVSTGTPTMNLTRSCGEALRHGARTIYARAAASGSNADFTAAFAEVIKEDVQIVIAPELDTADAASVLGALVDSSESEATDLLAVIGADGADVSGIQANASATPANDRIVLCAPGYLVPDTADTDNDVALSGTFMATPVAALISTLTPQSSPTNKVLSGLSALTRRFSYSERIALVQANVLALEQRGGIRVVRGLTTDTGGFRQITTRRIVDFAKAGIRQVGNAFIGRLNNERVRAALQGAIDGFLTGMLVDEQLTAYNLDVTATRRDEIEGRAVVNVLLQPTFSIDFVAVTIVLQ